MLSFYDILAFYDISPPGIHLQRAEKTAGSDLTAGTEHCADAGLETY
jgi:hypothetical protein